MDAEDAAAEAADEPIDLDKPVYLSLEGRWTKKTGYARPAKRQGRAAVVRDKSVRGLEKAKDADVFALRLPARGIDSPNFFAGADLKSRPNESAIPIRSPPQYAWGQAELVDYKNSHGDRLQGALYYPANYEKGKQYPMIVQIYEIESNQLHNWTAPSERATYNPAVWTQHGYFVFRPDIVFKPRDPGISALDCVTSGVKKVLENGHGRSEENRADGTLVGRLRDHLYPDATDLFAAGVAGGPLTNLASSYGEIYWNSGGPETESRRSGPGAHAGSAV